MLVIPLPTPGVTDDDLPDVEHFTYTMPDGSAFKATVSRTIRGHWVGDIWDERIRRVWVSPMPFRSRSALIQRCTEEVDREFRRRRAA